MKVFVGILYDCNMEFQHFLDRYVEQNDIHTPFITVKESLEFSSALRLPKQTSSASRQKYINEVTSFTPISHKLCVYTTMKAN